MKVSYATMIVMCEMKIRMLEMVCNLEHGQFDAEHVKNKLEYMVREMTMLESFVYEMGEIATTTQ